MEKEHKVIYSLLGLIVVLLLVSISIQLTKSNDNLTAWATIKSRDLHKFMQDCRDNGGTVDVRPNEAPQIIFECAYPDRTVEYTLEPGK